MKTTKINKNQPNVSTWILRVLVLGFKEWRSELSSFYWGFIFGAIWLICQKMLLVILRRLPPKSPFFGCWGLTRVSRILKHPKYEQVNGGTPWKSKSPYFEFVEWVFPKTVALNNRQFQGNDNNWPTKPHGSFFNGCCDQTGLQFKRNIGWKHELRVSSSTRWSYVKPQVLQPLGHSQLWTTVNKPEFMLNCRTVTARGMHEPQVTTDPSARIAAKA